MRGIIEYSLDPDHLLDGIFYLFNQEEVINVVQKLRGLIVWSLS
jgi:hypothetical protein